MPPPLVESPIFVRCHDLLKWLLQVMQHFPRSQRFVLAARIQDRAFELQESLLAAGTRTGDARRRHLEAADLALSHLRHHLRLSLDMGWLSMGQYEHVSRMSDEVGRLLGGWIRKERERGPAS